MVHGSDVVITICQELQDTVERMGVGERALLIENVMGGDVEDAPSLTPGDDPAALEHSRRCAARALHRHVRGVSGRRSADRRARPRSPRRIRRARVLVVGGEPAQVEAARAERPQAAARAR